MLTAISALGTATPSAFSGITVTPTGGATDPGFNFDASFQASTASLISVSSVTFTVAYTATSPVDEFFLSTDLFLTNPSVAGLGLITAAEALCLDGSFTSPLNPGLCSGAGLNTALASNITNANLNSTVTFDTGPVSTLGVIKQITLTSGLGGSASTDALNNGFAATVPESSTWTLAAIPLLMLGFVRRRARAAVEVRGRDSRTGA